MLYKKIIAIGGGEIGRPGFSIETTLIDKEIIKLTNKKNPKLLFIPTDSGDSEVYFDVAEKYFGKKLGCKVEVLYLLKSILSKKEIEEAIFSTDIVYVGGGDTLKMMKLWRRFGVDKILEQACKQGIIMSGISAGANCWFKFGNADSRKIKNSQIPLTKVSGLNFIPALLCPHYDCGKDRKSDLKRMMRKTSGVSLALDDCCAIEIIDGAYRIISSKDTANAYKVFWLKGEFNEILLRKEKKLLPIFDLLMK